jgi:hypothetical protein
MTLVSLVYVSHAVQNFSDEQLHDLLTVSRNRNLATEITGMLLYRDGFFFQALEGEDQAVEAVYEKIKRDPRHRGVYLIYKEVIAQRSFPNWSMGFKLLDDSALESVAGYNSFLTRPDPHFFVDKPSRAKALLTSFRRGGRV